MPATRIYNRCNPKCEHNTMDSPELRVNELTTKREKHQSEERHRWEARRNEKAARLWMREYAELGLAKLKERPGRPTEITSFTFNPDDARIGIAGRLFLIPCQATADKLGDGATNYILIEDREIAHSALLAGKEMWCLDEEAAFAADVRDDLSKEMAEAHATIAAEKLEWRHTQIRALRDAGQIIGEGVSDADLSILWSALQKEKLTKAVPSLPSSTAPEGRWRERET